MKKNKKKDYHWGEKIVVRQKEGSFDIFWC